ncbi:uncharacterized protein YbaP (TraB family) [Nonlabens dokdonensis]|uniref:GumN family protein n=2 Tax=Nonlabens dokdonensis TaxID=328515 RepID=L7WAW5_NONDD|nr:TraB/GumN family protein [Nonlabens dokdonensis]AGC77259.1 GumN family protein [Nonlabens dokdonensis DSW-6]PZX40794.1 uncharacterized protein YbaP (TraB family) [Nonlabens dokdonensis]
MYKSFSSFFSSVFFLFLFISLNAQERENYSLLWEVQNPNTKEISYVFGTMHLSDARVFEFSDAVFPAIQSTEAFALEIAPDSLEAGLEKYMLVKKDLSRYKKVLGKEKYKELDSKIQGVIGISLDSLQYNSLEFLSSILIPDLTKENDEETFLDLFLYNVALNENKEIRGLEKVEDQIIDMDLLSDQELKESLLELLEDQEGFFRKELDNMVEIYHGGNIEEVYSKLKEFETEEDYDLIARNQVMASSIEQITNQRTLFTAIGVAHLPGKYGVLELLKNKGFRVKKSKATFNNPNMDLIAQSSFESWESYSYDKEGYELIAPRKSNTIKTSLSQISSTGTGTDLINGVEIVHLSIKIPEDKLTAAEEMIILMTDRYKTTKEGYEFQELDSYSKNGVEYNSILATKENRLSRLDLYLRNGRAYIFTADFKNTANSQKTAKRFFDSIRLFEQKEKAFEWSVLEPEKAAFKVDFPVDFKTMEKQIANPQEENGDPYKLTIFHAVNAEKKEQYLVRYNDYPLGYYLEDIEGATQEYIELIKTKGFKILEKNKTTHLGAVAYDLEIKILDTIHGRMRIFYRGNRLYLLLIQSYDVDKEISMKNRLFDTFTFKDYVPAIYDEIALDEGYRFKFPKSNVVAVDSSDYNQADLLFSRFYQGYDENSGNAFSVSQTRFGKYFRTNDKDVYFKEYEDELFENDSIVKKTPFTYNNISGIEYLINIPSSNIQQRYRLFYKGQNVFLLGTHQDRSNIYSANTEEFFNGFETSNEEVFDMEASKSKTLLTDLLSNNEETYNDAHNALDYYDFEKNDAKDLLTFIKKDYPKDSLYYGTKNMLIYSLALVKDPAYLDEFKKIYLSTGSEYTKAIIIQSLPLFESEKAIELQMSLLQNNDIPKLEDYSLTFLESENDSLIDLTKYGNQIWDLQKKSGLRDLTLNYFNRKITTDEKTLPFLKERKQELATLFQEDASAVASGLDDYTKHLSPYELSSYFKLLDTLEVKDQQTMKYIKELVAVEVDRAYVHLNALEHYLKYEPKVDKKLVRGFIEDLYFRFEGMELIAKNGYSKMIPKSYFKDEEFAKLSVYNALYDYDENMLIKHLGEIEENEATYIVYQFNYTTYEDDTNYIALARKHKIDKNKPEQFEVWLSGDGFVNNQWQVIAQSLIEEWQAEEVDEE